MKQLPITLLVIIHLLFSRSVVAQNIPIGGWEEALVYRNAVGVAASNNKIYCATELSLYSVDLADNSLQRFSKVNGLSDIETSVVAFDNNHQLLLIAYKNSNVDIIQNGSTINISDIKRQNIIGDKNIYGIYFYGDYAYLSCGFGIVVVDLNKFEIKETYYIGANGTAIQVFDVAADGTYIYAATEDGLLRAELSNPNLINYSNWQTLGAADGLPNDTFSDVVVFNNAVYASHDDSIYRNDGATWSAIYGRVNNPVRKLEAGINRLLICHWEPGQINMINEAGEVDSFATGFSLGRPYQAIEKDGAVWVADLYAGLVKISNGYGEVIYPNGPFSKNTFDLTVNSSTHNVYVASGAWSGSFGFTFIQDGFFVRKDNWWSAHNIYTEPTLIDTFDIVCATINPANNRTYFGSMWNGIIEYDDELGITNQWTKTNSTLGPAVGDSLRVKATDIAFDAGGNMWVSNMASLEPIVVRKADGDWLKFKPTVSLDQQRVTDIAFDPFGQVWIVLPRQGMLVFNYGADLESTGDDQYKLLATEPGNGNLPSSYINCATTDQQGNIWVGTNSGVGIFYCTGDVFSEQGCDAQQIVITAEDGYNGYLLGTENVKRIVIDGANRKWVATDNGVWLFSADGTEEILHLTTDNSPLFSNFITSLAIDHTTGHVYIGTEKGVMIYRGDATISPAGTCSPFVFPNPVRENYTGVIAVSGVANNSEVKITDMAGNLIFRTDANGGEVIWDGNGYDGKRAATGVYLVFTSNADGSLKCVAKLLMVN